MVEHSAGAAIFRKEKGKIYYLLLRYPEGARTLKPYWDLPKGHIEKGETETDTVKREIFEETGLKDIDIKQGFKERIDYFFTADGGETIFKTVVFYLAQTQTEEIKISEEHTEYKWLPYEEAVLQLTFKNAKNVIEKANRCITA